MIANKDKLSCPSNTRALCIYLEYIPSLGA